MWKPAHGCAIAGLLLLSACAAHDSLDAGACRHQADCRAGEVCSGGICRQACVFAWECPNLLGCRDGVCQGCESDSHCVGGHGCDIGTGQCLAYCGDGFVDAGETCDGSCPTACNDNAVCTEDLLTGSANDCSARCVYTAITGCENGDGCCAAGCDHSTDNDCSSTCGNERVDEGETCDGDCPASCDDGRSCTTDMLLGSASSCSAECSHTDISSCQSGDGCCPLGCNHASDTDCAPAGVTYVYLGNVTVDIAGTVEIPATIQPANALRTDLVWSTSAAASTTPGTAGGDATNGTITADGVYSPPPSSLIGDHVYRVWAVSKENASVRDYGWVSVTTTSASCVNGVAAGYQGLAMTPQAGVFEIVFDATPQAEPVETGLGLANHASLTGLDWSQLAAIVRFRLGTIDARNGGSYPAAGAISYTVGSTYRVREVVDVPNHVYSVYVTPPAGGEQLLASNYAFRTEQQGVASLNQWGSISDTGTLKVCLLSLTPVAVSGSCSDHQQNNGETDIDCGGSTSGCARCALDRRCASGTDCASTLCVNTYCQPTVTGTTYYVATPANNGSDGNDGRSLTTPWATWQKGFNAIAPGDMLYITGGTYTPTEAVVSHGMSCAVAVSGKNGNASSMYRVFAYPGHTPILDGRNLTSDSYQNIGVLLYDSDYWHLNGLHITRVDQSSGANHHGGQGLWVYGSSHNRIERIVAYKNGGPGIGARVNSTDNLFLNCDTYSNYDPYSADPGDDADGFDVGFISDGSVNTLQGCRSWNNSDDGFDMYQGAGYYGTYYLIDCWAWHNGYDDVGAAAGNGCGFKYGDDGQSYNGEVQRITYGSIAYDNRTRGFSQESANVKKLFYNNISYGNDSWGWSFWGLEVGDILMNNVALGDGIEQLHSGSGTRVSEHNSWDSGFSVTTADFDVTAPEGLAAPRGSDGSLPSITFLHLKSGSALINAGTPVEIDGTQKPYLGSAPDLGAFERE